MHCLTVINAAAATFADIPSDYTSISHSFSVSADRSRAYAVAAGAHTPYSLIELDLTKAAVTHVIDSIIPPCKPEFLPVPRALCIPGTGGRDVHAILHPATHPDFSASGPTPLIVTAHGGPTSAATAALRLKFAYVLPASTAKVLALIISSTPAATSPLEASAWWTSTTQASTAFNTEFL
jgi:dipeptidyl aminopeptidase/acylaminoacyl peptidase